MNNDLSGEQNVIAVARARSEQCLCGDVHADGGVTLSVVARIRGYLAEHPGHRFAVDDEYGIVAVIIARDPGLPGPPEVVAWSEDLLVLLDKVGAPSAAGLS